MIDRSKTSVLISDDSHYELEEISMFIDLPVNRCLEKLIKDKFIDVKKENLKSCVYTSKNKEMTNSVLISKNSNIELTKLSERFNLSKSNLVEKLIYDKFIELGVWNWVRDFDKLAEYEPLPDGFSWNLNANIKDKKIKSSGNNTYPKSYNELIRFFDKISSINNFKNLRYYDDSEIDMVVDGY